MSTPIDQTEILLTQLSQSPCADSPEMAEALEVWEGDLRDELKKLHQSNEEWRARAIALQNRANELESFARTVAHNLKDPLTAIIVTASAIIDIPDLSAREMAEYLQQIRATAFEMNETIENILLLSEVTRKEIPVEAIDMAAVVAGVRKRLKGMLENYHGRLRLPESWPTALGYAPWIGEVWANYISNALKYGGEAPVVELGAAARPDGTVRFWVRDYGKGLSVRDQKRLFTPFDQLGQPQRGSHGLGLSIVRRIVEKLGGQVGLESRPGHGSLFYFSLPAASFVRKSSPSNTANKLLRPVLASAIRNVRDAQSAFEERSTIS